MAQRLVCCWRTLHSVWSAKTYPYPIFTSLDSTQTASLPTLLSTAMPMVKKEELGFPSKSERQKKERLYTQGFAAYGFVRNLAKAAKLSPSKVREFLHSKTSYTRFTQATRKFKRMRAFARIKDENWCMDLAYVDELAKDNISVKYLLVRQDLFDRTADAKGMKTKDSKEPVKTFSKMITKKNRPKSGDRICWRVKEILQRWMIRKLLYNEWDESSICRTYNTLTQKHIVTLYGG